jgi:hypothetical protein
MIKLRLLIPARNLLTFLCLVTLMPFTSLVSPATAQAADFADSAFQSLWQRTDAPVAAGLAQRAFLWGAAPFATKQERYDESPKHVRTVQYFDKGRMELSYPNVNPTSPYYVTSGLLVRDLVSGLVQVGENKVQVFDPAELAVVGDPLQVNKNAPLYADFLSDLAYPAGQDHTGWVISTTIQAGRKLSHLATKDLMPDIKYAYYESHTNHNIAAPFWNYFNTKGLVLDNTGKAIADKQLFEWQFLMGYPISEPYWTHVQVGGKTTLVLVQLFERRVLSYTPSNAPQFQIEMGNVGQHYYNWRYGPPPVLEQNTSVPPSVNGTITPTYGDLNTIFSFSANGFEPNELLHFSLKLPNNFTLSATNPLKADSKGQISGSFQGADVSSILDANGAIYGTVAPGLSTWEGLYTFSFTGQSSNNVSTIYFKLLKLAPRTPATPYTNDQSVPASINAQVEPKAGPPGTSFTAIFNPFSEKDLGFDRVSIWVTTPQGKAVEAALDGAQISDDTPFGVVLALGSPPSPGIWAVTIQDKKNPQRQAIAYLRVTDAPPEATIGSAFSIIRTPTTANGLLFTTPMQRMLQSLVQKNADSTHQHQEEN